MSTIRTAPLRGVFVTATGTGVGKTFVARGLGRALVRRGRSVALLKPVETGCDPDPADAIALARACGRPELAHAPGFYRARAPLSPYAAALDGDPSPPDAATLAACVERAARDADLAVVEGAGGLFVPLRRSDTFATIAAELGLPLLVVAPDRLGVLSHASSLLRAAPPLAVGALVLTRLPEDDGDPSRRQNGAILAEHGVPVIPFETTADDDDALADEAERSGLVDRALELASAPPTRTPRAP